MTDSPYIGRIVVLITPLLAALSLFIVNAAQDLTGADLDGDELTALLTAAVLGISGVVFKWLDNRGKYERETAVIAETAATSDPSTKRVSSR